MVGAASRLYPPGGTNSVCPVDMPAMHALKAALSSVVPFIAAPQSLTFSRSMPMAASVRAVVVPMVLRVVLDASPVGERAPALEGGM